MPDPRNPFLGVHATVTVDGRAKVGPTAIPGLWREDYGGVNGFEPGETAESLLMLSRFLRSEHHDAGQLIRSEVPKYSRRILVNRVKPMIPSVRLEDFTIKGRVGVRAQFYDLRRKRLEMDFVVRGDERQHARAQRRFAGMDEQPGIRRVRRRRHVQSDGRMMTVV